MVPEPIGNWILSTYQMMLCLPSVQQVCFGQAVLLFHASPNATLCLAVHLSNVSIGGVLQQKINGTWHPISLFSKPLQPIVKPIVNKIIKIQVLWPIRAEYLLELLIKSYT